jgi:hypothetical protein
MTDVGHDSAGSERHPPVLDRDPDAVETLSDSDLEVELTIAACAPGRLRWERYERLFSERLRRRLVAG